MRGRQWRHASRFRASASSARRTAPSPMACRHTFSSARAQRSIISTSSSCGNLDVAGPVEHSAVHTALIRRGTLSRPRSAASHRPSRSAHQVARHGGIASEGAVGDAMAAGGQARRRWSEANPRSRVSTLTEDFSFGESPASALTMVASKSASPARGRMAETARIAVSRRIPLGRRLPGRAGRSRRGGHLRRRRADRPALERSTRNLLEWPSFRTR